ncbi:GNAT family protein [Legionella anisa]|uniref:N-acetyltransferase n=2 Tax=Legionella anisa TaxID=28082 RepID=A0AAX0WUH0_9GAMM|nr:GNAT family protein [Legionella anisa]AWN74119.1 N-acetyltransferase [Legionella anisa]KTC70017.1 GNAT family acetyltransferase [Legionella anisa]MBN5935143.1 GNAT family N-acetyltransferase [Legionella anisa]MCW8448713.1 GNAT family N-acetyltransferase [Legionella anisa]PNL61979.1 N-acetyltransferase [Legionella anisa]
MSDMLIMPKSKTKVSTLVPENLIGQNIQMEPLTLSHYERLRHPANDARIWTYMPNKANGEFYDAWFQNCLMKQIQGIQLTYVIRRLKDNELIGGRAYYEIDLHHKKLEVGYGWLTPSVWGKQYNHESLLLLFQNAFEIWNINRIQIATDPRNIKNYNTLKKLGATREGILRQHMIHHNGQITDTVLFSILAEEWPEVKKKLVQRLDQIGVGRG